MLKLTGAILVLMTSAGLGFSVGMDARKRCMELRVIKQFLYMLRGEIKYTKNPLPEVFASMAERLGAPFSSFLLGASEELFKRDGRTFSEIWSERSEVLFQELHLKTGDRELWLHLGESLGYLDQEMQLASIELYVEQLEQEITDSQQALFSKLRLCNCLGVMGGVFLLILML